MPTPTIWGPKLWKVLHCIGYYSARSPEIMKRDVKREFDWLLVNLETIIPCIECRQHLEEYKKINGYPLTISDISEWMWKFHEAVNTRLGKPSVPYRNDIGKLDPNEKIRKIWNDYLEEIADNVQIGQVTGISIQKFQQHFLLWKGFCGF